MIAEQDILLRVGVAAILGSLVGFERERKDWVAGLRDHILVCIGAALFMIVSSHGFYDVLNTPQVALDPSRIAAQVVSGIGFLGAGTILVRGDIIKGLTTAASLWTVAAVGLASGAGMFAAATAVTILIIIVLAGIKPLEKIIFTRRKTIEITIVSSADSIRVDAIERVLNVAPSELLSMSIERTESPELRRIVTMFHKAKQTDLGSILQQLHELPGVQSVIHHKA